MVVPHSKSASRRRERARRRIGACAALALLAGLALGLAPVAAAAGETSSAAPISGPASLPGPTLSAARPAPGDYCTFARCGPRRGQPLIGVAGFGLAIAGAGWAARRRPAQPRA